MGFIIPIIVIAANQVVQHPDVILATGKWPHIPHIVNTMDHDIRNHLWFQLRKSGRKVDKGKGKAIELPHNTVVGPSRTTVMEVDKSGGHVGEPSQTSYSPPVPDGAIGESSRTIADSDESQRGCSRSRGRKPRKCGQSVATMNSDGDGEQASPHPQPK